MSDVITILQNTYYKNKSKRVIPFPSIAHGYISKSEYYIHVLFKCKNNSDIVKNISIFGKKTAAKNDFLYYSASLPIPSSNYVSTYTSSFAWIVNIKKNPRTLFFVIRSSENRRICIKIPLHLMITNQIENQYLISTLPESYMNLGDLPTYYGIHNLYIIIEDKYGNFINCNPVTCLGIYIKEF
jgi:hypothetical protein